MVWVDTNGDGVKDSSEDRLAGIGVTLTTPGADGIFGTSDDSLATTTTVSDGSYSFASLTPERYRIQLDLSDPDLGDRVLTYEVDGSLNGSVDLRLSTGENRSDIDFGLRAAAGGSAATISDRVWEDSDGDSVQDSGEVGIGNALVRLVWSGIDGQFGSTDDITTTVKTSSSGIYSFSGLAAGVYQVTVDGTTLPSGMSPTYDPDGGRDSTTLVQLASGELLTDVDFGYSRNPTPPDPGVISGTVWFDLDVDTTQGSNEPGLARVTIQLRGSSGVSYRTVTDSSGNYRFDGVPAGSYTVRVILRSLPPGVEPFFDRDGGTDALTQVSLSIGQVRDDVDFGVVGIGFIGDRLWHDADADYRQDTGETGVNNINMTIEWAGFDGIFGTSDDITRTRRTGTTFPPGPSRSRPALLLDGYYWFDYLPLGVYRVRAERSEVNSVGLPYQTFELDGNPDGQVELRITGEQYRVDVDSGFLADPNLVGSGQIAGQLWLDSDGDGTIDVGEEGLPQTLVRLREAGADGIFGTADDLSFEHLSAGDGSYSFSSLPVGNYQIEVDGSLLPAGLNQTYERDGSLNGLVSEALSAGEVVTQVNFGYRGAGVIAGVLWIDQNRDGVRQSAEERLDNVTVQVRWYGRDGLPGGGDDKVVQELPTNTNGEYRVEFLPFGTYRVTVATAGRVGFEATYELDTTWDGAVETSLSAAALQRTQVDFGYVALPSMVTLTELRVVRDSATSATVHWATASEVDSWGFLIYRSTTARRADAERVTPQLITAQGGGSSYSWRDRNVQSGKVYYYWLIEVELNGTRNEHGPVRVDGSTLSQMHRVLLPFITR